MATRDAFREFRNLGRSALGATESKEIQHAIDAVYQAVHSRAVVGKRAKRLRGLRRTLEQKLSRPV